MNIFIAILRRIFRHKLSVEERRAIIKELKEKKRKLKQEGL
jgi:hypothetical protein